MAVIPNLKLSCAKIALLCSIIRNLVIASAHHNPTINKRVIALAGSCSRSLVADVNIKLQLYVHISNSAWYVKYAYVAAISHIVNIQTAVLILNFLILNDDRGKT